jgi:hypothetical protein
MMNLTECEKTPSANHAVTEKETRKILKFIPQSENTNFHSKKKMKTRNPMEHGNQTNNSCNQRDD